jgi:hypothetical protein
VIQDKFRFQVISLNYQLKKMQVFNDNPCMCLFVYLVSFGSRVPFNELLVLSDFPTHLGGDDNTW